LEVFFKNALISNTGPDGKKNFNFLFANRLKLSDKGFLAKSNNTLGMSRKICEFNDRLLITKQLSQKINELNIPVGNKKTSKSLFKVLSNDLDLSSKFTKQLSNELSKGFDVELLAGNEFGPKEATLVSKQFKKTFNLG